MIMSTKEICKRGLSMTISLTLGNTGFPPGHRPAGYQHLSGQLFLGQAFLSPQGLQKGPDLFLVHGAASSLLTAYHLPRRNATT